MERLTGNSRGKSNSNNKPVTTNNRSSSNTKPPLNSSSNKKINNYTSNSNTKPTFGAPKKDNAKDILNRMK